MIAILRSPAAEHDRYLAYDRGGQPGGGDPDIANAAKIERLADHPRMGLRRPDIRPAARMLVDGPYLILYQTHPDTDDGQVDAVEIVRVVDGRRDLTILF